MFIYVCPIECSLNKSYLSQTGFTWYDDDFLQINVNEILYYHDCLFIPEKDSLCYGKCVKDEYAESAGCIDNGCKECLIITLKSGTKILAHTKDSFSQDLEEQVLEKRIKLYIYQKSIDNDFDEFVSKSKLQSIIDSYRDIIGSTY